MTIHNNTNNVIEICKMKKKRKDDLFDRFGDLMKMQQREVLLIYRK